MSSPVVILKPRRALPFFGRHPWVFAGAVSRVRGNPQPGDEVVVRSADDEFIARGLFNPHSNIRARLYTWNEEEPLDDAIWTKRIAAAIDGRRQLFGEFTSDTACRLINSEGDGLSGLVVDRYGEWLLVQFTSLALYERRDAIISILAESLQPRGVWLRTEKGIRKAEGLEARDGLIAGEEPPRPLFLEEHGVRYGVDVVEGQKTGFFLDQRENRRAVAEYLARVEQNPGISKSLGSCRVLDVFCYNGGFSLAAAMLGGAKETLGVDSSETAITLARANAELNGVADRCHFERADAFEKLEQLTDAGERFDAVVLDPPKLCRHRKAVPQALKGYFSLNRLAVGVLNPGGLLVSCSCSGLVSREEFEEMLATVAVRSGREMQILEIRGQSPDHPVAVTCREGAYLKCYVCRVV
jgi:23S rRNA (cytosine1962-C5)-methyltransferase